MEGALADKRDADLGLGCRFKVSRNLDFILSLGYIFIRAKMSLCKLSSSNNSSFSSFIPFVIIFNSSSPLLAS